MNPPTFVLKAVSDMVKVHSFVEHRSFLTQLIHESNGSSENLMVWQNYVAIIDAMKADEHEKFDTLEEKAINRIAFASGTSPARVNEFFFQYVQTAEMIQTYYRMTWWQRIKFIWKMESG